MNQEVVLQDNQQSIVPKPEVTGPSPLRCNNIKNASAACNETTNVMETLDNSKNPTNDINMEHMTAGLFNDSAIPPVIVTSEVDTMEVAIPCGHTESSWSQTALSLNGESENQNALMSDKTLNQLRLSEAITSVTQADTLITGQSTGVNCNTDQTPSLDLPLVSPTESKTKPIIVNMSTDLPPCKENILLSPKLTSPLVSPNLTVKSPETLLSNGYTVPKISLLQREDEVPKPPPRPELVSKDQLYPPTPSITVSNCSTVEPLIMVTSAQWPPLDLWSVKKVPAEFKVKFS